MPVTTGKVENSQLAVFLGAAMVAGIVVAAFCAALALRSHEIQVWRQQLDNHSLTLAEHTYQTMASAYIALDGIAERVRAEGADSPEAFRRIFGTVDVYRMLKEKTEFLPQIDVATIVADNGDVINFTRNYPAPHINLAERDYFKEHARRPDADGFVSISVRNKGNGKWVFYISHRVNDRRGNMIGLV